jgi:hypothetical protein
MQKNAGAASYDSVARREARSKGKDMVFYHTEDHQMQGIKNIENPFGKRAALSLLTVIQEKEGEEQEQAELPELSVPVEAFQKKEQGVPGNDKSRNNTERNSLFFPVAPVNPEGKHP